jgi:hypothetical protein
MSENWDHVWASIERDIVKLIAEDDAEAAINKVNEVISTNPPTDVACAALICRASAKDDLGDLPGALVDLQEGHRLSELGTYRRYTIELTIGGILSSMDEPEESISWYRTALQTVLAGKDLSGGSALRRFLELRGEDSLNSNEKALCAEVARTSWKTLRQAGEPDLTSLTNLAERLVAIGSRPVGGC